MIGSSNSLFMRQHLPAGEPANIVRAGIRNHKANQNIAKLVSYIQYTDTGPYTYPARIRKLASIIHCPLVHGNTTFGAALININHFIRSFQNLKGTISHVAHLYADEEIVR